MLPADAAANWLVPYLGVSVQGPAGSALKDVSGQGVEQTLRALLINYVVLRASITPGWWPLLDEDRAVQEKSDVH